MSRFGKEHYSQTKEFIERTTNTCHEHFGVYHPMHSKNIKDKILNIFREKYGSDNPLSV